MRISLALLASIVLVASAGLVRADDVPMRTAGRLGETLGSPDAAELNDDSLKERLATGDYASRQQATMELWRQRESMRDLVHRAARDEDPEVAGRAGWILNRWQRGILADTPSELAERLQGMDQNDAVDALLAAGRFHAVIVALDESAGTVDWSDLRRHAESVLQTKYPICIHAAHHHNRVDELIELLGRVTSSRALAITRVELMRLIGQALPDEALLPASAADWSDADRLVGLTQVLVVLDRIDDAVSLLSQPDDLFDTTAFGFSTDIRADGVAERKTQLHEVCLMMMGRWQTLCDSLQDIDVATLDNDGDLVWYYSRLLIAADRNGDQAIKNSVVDALLKIARSPDAAQRYSAMTPFHQQLAWAPLLVHGELDAAEEVLRLIDPMDFSELALACSKPTVALQRLGFTLEKIDSQLESVIERSRVLFSEANDGVQPNALPQPDDSPDKSRPSGPEITKDQLQRMIRYLFASGRRDIAWDLCSRIAAIPVPEDPDQESDSMTPRRLVAISLLLSGEPKWMADFMLSPKQRDLHQWNRRYLAVSFGSNMDYIVWGRLDVAFQRVRRTATLDQRTEWIGQLSEGVTPSGFDRTELTDRLYRELTTNADAESRSNQFKNDDESRGDVDLPIEFAEFFLRLGRSDLWLRCIQNLQRRGDLNASLEYASWARRYGRLDNARKILDMLSGVLEREDGVMTWMLQNDTNDLALKLPVAELSLAVTSQDADEESRQRRLLGLLACSPEAGHRQTLLEALKESGNETMAMDVTAGLLGLLAMEQGEITNFADIAGQYASSIHESDPDEAVKWMELRLIAMLQDSGTNSATFVANALLTEGFRIEAAIKSTDENAARRAIDRIDSLDSLEIDHLERLLPEMSKVGWGELVDVTLDRAIAQGKRHFMECPFDTPKLNNLAWGLAVNEKQLDLALEWSRRAIVLEPDSAIYRDTLAEILYRRGQREEALQIEKACLLDSPGEHHLYKQIERFENGRD